MRIFDPTILALPFFEDRHRDLAVRLESWIAANWALPEMDAELCTRERGRRYTRLLGEAGWFGEAFNPGESRRPDLRSICLIREAFAYFEDLVDFAFSIQALSCAPLAWFGSPAQRETYLNDAHAGRQIGSLSLSEPTAGSNLASVACLARATETGYELQGRKNWVANGDISDFSCVLVRTGDGPGGLGLSMMVLPLTSRDRVRVEPVNFLAPRACANLTFDNFAIDRGALIGESGSGCQYATEILDFYRVSVGAAAVGFGRRACHAALQWAATRQVIGGALLHTQLTQAKFADMDVQLHASALLVARAAWEFDNGSHGGSPRNAAMAKLYATEEAQRIVDQSLQLFGAAGLTETSVTARLYRQIRSLRVYEGTSEIQRMIIASGMKAQ